MASTPQRSAASATPYRSFGRTFAAVDPERQREVNEVPLPALAAPAFRTRTTSPSDRFRLAPSPSAEGDSCRRGR